MGVGRLVTYCRHVLKLCASFISTQLHLGWRFHLPPSTPPPCFIHCSPYLPSLNPIIKHVSIFLPVILHDGLALRLLPGPAHTTQTDRPASRVLVPHTFPPTASACQPEPPSLLDWTALDCTGLHSCNYYYTLCWPVRLKISRPLQIHSNSPHLSRLSRLLRLFGLAPHDSISVSFCEFAHS